MKVALALALTMTLTSCCTTANTNYVHGIPNFYEVAPGIWRGGQPNKEGWAWLTQQGVRRVVKLNTWSEGSDTQAYRCGMQVCSHPITLSQMSVLRPTYADIHAAVREIQFGTFVHCQHGQDRTGLVIACWRLSTDWDKKGAEEEMMAYGFHTELQGLYGFWLQQREEDWTSKP